MKGLIVFLCFSLCAPLLAQEQEQDDRDYMFWLSRYEKAKSKELLATGMSAIGFGVAAAFTLAYFLDYDYKTVYLWGIPVESDEKEYKTGYLIGAIGGVTLTLVSVLFATSADTQVKLLEIEGKRKGYIEAGIIPMPRGAALTLSFRF